MPGGEDPDPFGLENMRYKWRKWLLTSDSAFLFHIAELETAVRQNQPLVCVVGVDHQWGLEVGVYKRTFFQSSPQPRRALEQGCPDGQYRRGLRLPR